MIDKLEVVLALARERHFGRAAEALGVSQSALSAALRSLEDALGATLVDRSSRFQGFTPEGERVLGWARRIVADAEAVNKRRNFNPTSYPDQAHVIAEENHIRVGSRSAPIVTPPQKADLRALTKG